MKEFRRFKIFRDRPFQQAEWKWMDMYLDLACCLVKMNGPISKKGVYVSVQ